MDADAPSPPPDAPPEAVRLELPFALGVTRVLELQEALVAALEQPGEIVLDAEGVDSADTLGLQLLLAFVRAAEAQQRAWRWEQPSSALRRMARLLGLDRELGLTKEAA